MRVSAGWILLFISVLAFGCSDNDIDIEVYDDVAVQAGVIIPITEDRVINEIRDNPTILIHFTSYDRNCACCVRSNKFVNQLAKNLSGRLTIGRISWNPWHSIKRSQELRKRLKFNGVPFLILFNNGRVVWRHDGYANEDSQLITKEITGFL